MISMGARPADEARPPISGKEAELLCQAARLANHRLGAKSMER